MNPKNTNLSLVVSLTVLALVTGCKTQETVNRPTASQATATATATPPPPQRSVRGVPILTDTNFTNCVVLPYRIVGGKAQLGCSLWFTTDEAFTIAIVNPHLLPDGVGLRAAVTSYATGARVQEWEWLRTRETPSGFSAGREDARQLTKGWNQTPGRYYFANLSSETGVPFSGRDFVVAQPE